MRRLVLLAFLLAAMLLTVPASASVPFSCEVAFVAKGACVIATPSETVDVTIEGFARGAVMTSFEALVRDALGGRVLAQCRVDKAGIVAEARCSSGQVRLTNAPLLLTCEVQGFVAGTFSCYAIPR